MSPNQQVRRLHAGHRVGLSFLTVQLILIGYARFIPERFFCWAPYDQHTHYTISVTIDGDPLSQREVQARYRYRAEAWEPRRIDNVFSIIRQYETTYGAGDGAEVVVTYSTNGEQELEWRWPR